MLEWVIAPLSATLSASANSETVDVKRDAKGSDANRGRASAPAAEGHRQRSHALKRVTERVLAAKFIHECQ